jgi:hypothetical protein
VVAVSAASSKVVGVAVVVTSIIVRGPATAVLVFAGAYGRLIPQGTGQPARRTASIPANSRLGWTERLMRLLLSSAFRGAHQMQSPEADLNQPASPWTGA